jgi:hypothetical protein
VPQSYRLGALVLLLLLEEVFHNELFYTPKLDIRQEITSR